MKNERTSQAGERPPRILVVEDDVTMRLLNTEVLVDSGYQVDTAEDGDVAWDTLQTKSYDLLVTDNNMPKVSGVELLKKLRAAHMALPAILVSGMMPTEELSQHPWLQIDATLSKPYTSSELLEKVKDVLRMAVSKAGRTETLLPMMAESRYPDRVATPSSKRAAAG
jgi:DNA-binding response OmpR family regulator